MLQILLMFFHCRIWTDLDTRTATVPVSFGGRFYSDSAFEKTISE